MGITKILFTLFFITCFVKNINSQESLINDLKKSVSTKIGKLSFSSIVDLIQYYKNDEIEILTLEMKKVGNSMRRITTEKISFGFSYSFERYDLYNQYEPNDGELYFIKVTSPIENDRFKTYHSLNIYISKENLYKLILELNTSEYYKYLSSKTKTGGVQKTFIYDSKNKNLNFIIQTFDGDKFSKISFLLNK